MAYTDTDAVNGVLGDHAATSSSVPTLTQLAEIIDDVAAQIDTCLQSVGVASIPVTDTDFARTLKSVNNYGARAQFLKGMFPEATGPGENPAFAFWQKLYDDIIEGWKDPEGPFGLPTGLLGGPGDADPSTYFTRNPNEEEILGDLQESMDVTRFGDTF